MPFNLPPELGPSRSIFVKRPPGSSDQSFLFGFDDLFDLDTPFSNLVVTILEVPANSAAQGISVRSTTTALTTGQVLTGGSVFGLNLQVSAAQQTAASGTFRFSVSDGTTTIERSVAINVETNTQVQPLVFFAATDDDGLRKLYSLSPSGAVRAQSGSSFNFDLDPTQITATTSQLYMVGGDTDREIAYLDPAASNRISFINVNTLLNGSADPEEITRGGGSNSETIFFSATDGQSGRELWSVTGITATRVSDIRTGSAGSNPENLILFNNRLWFTADDGSGRELWQMLNNGTLAEIEINPTSASSNPSNLVVSGTNLFFIADNGDGQGIGVFRSTSAGVVTKVGDLPVTSFVEDAIQTGGARNKVAFAFNGDYYFVATDAANGRELWKATTSTVSRVSDVNPGALNSEIVIRGVFAGHLFFTATNDTTGNELYKLSTAGVVTLVADLRSNSGATVNERGSFAGNFTTLDGVTYFTAQDSALGFFEQSLFRINADATVTRVSVFDFAVGSGMFAGPGGRLIFGQGGELGIVNPVAAPELIDVTDINLDGSSNPDGFAVFNFSGPTPLNMAGGPGADLAFGESSERNLMSGGDGDDTLVGGSQTDTLSGGGDADDITGGIGNDSLLGGAGNDTIFGYRRDQSTLFGTDDDTINGGDGDDHLIAAFGFDQIIGGAGNDLIEGGEVVLGRISISGNPAQRVGRFAGDAGDDSIFGGWGEYSGGDGNDLVVADGGDDDIFGGRGADTLVGGSGDDEINGAEQFSTVQGDGRNVLDGGLGDDTLEAGDAGDLLLGGFGRDRINGGRGNDSAEGGGGDDFIRGYAFTTDDDILDSDTLDGGAGNDRIDGGSGSDLLLGGAGRDTIDGDNDFISNNGQINIEVFGRADTIDGGDGEDSIRGLRGDDVILGGNGNDYAEGGIDNDLIFGFFGRDILWGGAGNDTLRGEQDGDFLLGEDGDDLIEGAEGDDVLYGWFGADTINGGVGNDEILGEQDNDLLLGGAGNDSMRGSIGNDVVDGEDGDDTLNGGADQDLLLGGTGLDQMDGADGDDTLFGFFGNDTLLGGNGNDLIRGEQDNDLAFGFAGADTMFGGLGDDTLFGELDDDVLLGDEGADVLVGQEGADSMFGFTGADTIFGFIGNDSLFGEQGNDSLLGEDGDDVFAGGLGSDTMTGGLGADRFFTANFEMAAGDVDRITAHDAADRYLFQTGTAVTYVAFAGGAGMHVGLAGGGLYILDVIGANTAQLQAQTQFF